MTDDNSKQEPSAESAGETAAVPMVQPRKRRVERVREALRDGSRLRSLYDSAFLAIDSPTRFTEPHAELVERLTPRAADGTVDEVRTAEVLDEAQATLKSADERIDGAERRATTLLSAVTVATSLLLAGGALLADATKVHGPWWRAALATFLVLTVGSLLLAGIRALGATVRIHVVHRPTPTNILERTSMPVSAARIDLAAETLKDFGFNAKVADWKVAHLAAAAWWFRWALAFLIALTVVLGAYAILGAGSGASQNPPSSPKSVSPTPTSSHR
jgi:hypothetical protein